MKKYLLRNKLTGLFFNGTNFSAADVFGTFSNGAGLAPDAGSVAVILEGEQNEVAIRAVWGDNAQLIEVTNAQLELLQQSAKCEARAAAYHREGIQLREAVGGAIAGPKFSAATRLNKKATALAVAVYATFPRVGALAR